MFKRVVGGGSFFMTEYRAMGAPGEVAFATKVPGHIVPVTVNPGNEYLVHRHGFLCATPQVTIGVGFQQSLGAGIFGGDGFRLQKVSGSGTAWLELSGELIRKDLSPGETLRVHPRSRRRIPVLSKFSDHHRAGHQERDLRRRRPFPGGTQWPGNCLVTDIAHLTTGASDC